jgi:hypothetical protein
MGENTIFPQFTHNPFTGDRYSKTREVGVFLPFLDLRHYRNTMFYPSPQPLFLSSTRKASPFGGGAVSENYFS